MNISGRRTREPTVRSLAMDELLNDYHALERPTSRVSSQGSRLAMESSVRAGSLRDARVPPSNNTILRLDADGREREQRKVSNRENFVDTGRVSSSLRTQQEMETYEYDSSAENSVHYINDGEPVPTKSRPHPDKRTNRTVDTVIPTVPRLAMPSSSVHDTSFGSQQSRDTEQGACSSPPSSRSEKLQRTLKSISLNEREPFPSVRARIARQRESEGKVKDSRSSLLGNTNNNAVGDSSSAEVLSKPVHTEEDTVELNSSPESVIVRPIKRKVATAPEVSTKAAKSVPRTTATRKEVAKSAGLKTEGSRSKSADWTKSHAQPKWVDKTPGKPRSASASGKDEGAVRRPPTIRPDSWRQGMAVVNRELKQKQSRQPSREREDSRPNSARSDRSAVSVSSNQKLPAVAQEVLAALNGGDKEDPGVHADEPKSQPQPIRRKTKAKPVETPAPVIKQRHYDTQSIQMFMAKKKKEKRLLEMEERKKRLAAERERQEKLKSLQDRSRKAVSKVAQARAPPTVPLPARTSTSATFTSAKPALAATLMSSGTVWAPPVISSSSYIVNGCADVEQHTDPDIEAECSRLSDQEAGEGDTTLTEADLRAETPTKPFSRPESRVTTPRSRATTPRSTATTPRSTATTPRSTATTPRSTATTPRSRASTPRSKPGSPLSARTRAVEEEIEQLVQAAKHRNQLARQMQAQATPLKMMSQLTSTESTSTESYSASRVQVSSKSARINSLAQTTAQLMNKMNMLKADLENSAMSRSPSRAATSNYDYQWLRSPAGNRASGGGLASSGKVSAKGDQSESTTTEIVTDEEDHTHSTVSDSSKTHSTVTTDSELSDNESELSSLDIRIREALARPTNFSQSIRSQATKPSTDIVKPVAKVARTLMYTESNRGDGHSVINTYLRKLKADREALTCSGRVLPTTSSTHSTGALASTGIQTDMSPTTNSAPPVSNFIQPITSAESSTAARMSHPAVTRPSSQPAMSHVTLHSHTAPNQSLLLRPSLTQSPLTQPTLTEPSLTEPAGQHLQTSVTIRPSQSVPITSQSQSVPITSQSQSAPVTSQSQSVPITSQSQSVPITSQSQNAPITSQSQSVPITSQSHFIPPPSYSARPRTTLQGPAPRISPAGLDLAMTAGISLLEGLNQQQVQLSDVERTRFTALAQQETVALAQILKGSKERQERHLMSLREKIKQDEVEMQQKIAQFKREAELANQRGEDAERQSKVEASRLSRDATRRVLEAQTESTKAFTEASKLLAERRERLNDSENQLATSAKSVVDTLKAQNEVVTASLTTLVDQQRQQNLEILRLARMEPQGIRVADARSPVDRKLLRSPRSSSRTHSPRDRKSPRERKSRKVSSRSPRESSKSPRDASKSPRGTKSPRPRKLRSPADLSFQDIAERSDLSTTSTRHSDGMTHSDSVASYSEDFSSPSGKSSHSKSSPLPRANQLAAHSKSFSVTENIVGGDGDGSSIKTDSEVKSVKEDSINTDISEHSAGSKVSVSAADDSLTSRSRSKSKEETESKSRLSDTGSSSTNGDSPLHKVVLGVVKEVFSDSSSAQLQSDPSFYDKLKSVLYSLKEGGGPAPAALSTPYKSSPSKPPMVAPLSPRFDRRLTMRRPAGSRSTKRSTFSGDSESDESHSLLETASDTDQECQLSALQHQLDEAKRRHAMMKKARQKYEFQKKQDTYKMQIEYYEEDMIRMKKEMEDLAALQSHAAAAGSVSSPSAGLSVRPQIKQPRAPSSSGSDNGKQRHSSGTSDADQPTPQPSVIQKPLVGKSIGQLNKPSYERQRSDSGRSVDSESEGRRREKTPESQLEDSTPRLTASASKLTSVRTSPDKDVKDTPRSLTADYTYSNGFDDVSEKTHSSVSESIAESIESFHSSKRLSDSSLSQASDLMNLNDSSTKVSSPTGAKTRDSPKLEEPSLMDLGQDIHDSVFTPEESKSATQTQQKLADVVESAEDKVKSVEDGVKSAEDKVKSAEDELSGRSRSDSGASSRTLTGGQRSRSVTPERSHRSRSPSPSSGSKRSGSRSSRAASFISESRSRSRTPSSYTSTRSQSPSHRSRSRSVSEILSVASASPQTAEPSDDEAPLLDLGLSVDQKEENLVEEEKPLLDLDLTTTSKTKVDDSAREELPSEHGEKIEDSYHSDFSTAKSDSVSEKSADKSDSVSEKSDAKSDSVSEKSADKSDSVSEKSADNSDAELADKSEVELLEKSDEIKLLDKSDYEPSEKSEKSFDKSGDKSVDKSEESLVDRSEEKSHDRSGDEKSHDRSGDEKSHDRSGDEKSLDKSGSSEDLKSSISTASSVEEEIPYEDVGADEQSLSPVNIKSPELANQLQLDVKSPDLKPDEPREEDLLPSAYEQNPGLSLKEELDAALAEAGGSVDSSPRQPSDRQEEAGLEPGERLAESTPRLADSETEEREQRDFEEMEKLLTERSAANTSDSSSQLSLGSRSPDFLEFSRKSDKQTESSAKDKTEKSEEESELEKAISSAAAAVEAFAAEMDPDLQTESLADVGLSVMEETTPRSLLSLESSAEDLLDDEQGTPKAVSPEVQGEETPKAPSPVEETAKLKREDNNQVDSVCSQLVQNSLDSVISLWKDRRDHLAASAPEVPPLSLLDSSESAAQVTPAETLELSAKPATEVEATVEETAGKERATPDKETTDEQTSPSASTSLLGALPPLVIKPVKSPPPSGKPLSEILSPPSSEESISPQKSPTKTAAAVVEEARHEHWVQLDKDIDSVFGANDSDWYDDEFLVGPESKSVPVISKKEILRVAAPQPVFIVPHEETEVKALADEALDIFWQARRCGESWNDLEPSAEYLDTGDQLELEATANTSFRSLMFDLIRDMLNDIYQNEESDDGADSRQEEPGVRSQLSRYYKHRQPPTTLDEVRKILHKHIYPTVTGKMVHPVKSSRVLPMSRTKRRDKLDAILTQELREEELSWLDYSRDELAVKHSLTESVFQVLLDDSVSAILGAYNSKHHIQPTTEL